ncbi:putative serine/threonine protein kinase IRE4 [Labeo rohita]|uniref:Serine/threonine protein kinase IRE4 n=1 Tax=Labeo rohita TaxID=84645 RepID=A0ABQ8MRZ3_LABRO|nr:putative serine/threonine protein kinase IRE4 [Labeo rohita]
MPTLALMSLKYTITVLCFMRFVCQNNNHKTVMFICDFSLFSFSVLYPLISCVLENILVIFRQHAFFTFMEMQHVLNVLLQDIIPIF